MSLSDKLSAAATETPTRLCKIGNILTNSSLSEQDKSNLQAVLDVSENDPSRINNNVIARILREEGYDVSNSAVDRHRRGDCPCKRMAN
jgi:methanogenic corrinoid protein MtbC1